MASPSASTVRPGPGSDFNMALLRQKEQAERELDVLRLRHLQDIEEARAAGVSEEVLARLRQEHTQPPPPSLPQKDPRLRWPKPPPSDGHRKPGHIL